MPTKIRAPWDERAAMFAEVLAATCRVPGSTATSLPAPLERLMRALLRERTKPAVPSAITPSLARVLCFVLDASLNAPAAAAALSAIATHWVFAKPIFGKRIKPAATQPRTAPNVLKV